MHKGPRIEKVNGRKVLMVNDRPFMALAGEIHNSSASSLAYMNQVVWPNVNPLNLNTIILPVYWEDIEVVEGIYDFTTIKGLIDQARLNNKKLVVLWFGLWKNGLSTYVPKWVKEDREKYPFVIKNNHEKIYTITPLCQAGAKKDGEAFYQLMKFIREYDEQEQTVIMMQIENEVGILGSDFDYRPEALEMLEQQVPQEVSEYCHQVGNWKEVFGDEAKEYLIAYHYAKTIESIAKRGKEAYDIPYFVNAWIEKFPYRPGNHPTGGPIGRLVPFWKAMASSLVACAPDIYVPNFNHVCDDYTKSQDLLIIPETRQDCMTVSHLIYALGKYNLLCFSPFAIEDFMRAEELDMTVMKNLSIDATAFDSNGTAKYLSQVYYLVQGMLPLIYKQTIDQTMQSVMQINEGDRGNLVPFDNCDIKITYKNRVDKQPKSVALVIKESDHKAYILGCNITIELVAKLNDDKQLGILELEEGQFIDGVWKRERVLNGDERIHINIQDMPQILCISWHTY